MRITLLGHQDIASLYALDRLIRMLPEHDFSAFTSAPPPEVAATGGPLAELQLIDRRLFSEYLAEPETGPALRNAAVLNSPNDLSGLDILRATAPDLVVSIRYRCILRDPAIAIPKLGVLNLHSGILPDYRGVMATFWAMLNGEREIGCTLHRIVNAGIDTGPIIAVSRQAANYDRSYLFNVMSLYADGCALIASTIPAIERGEHLGGQPQATNRGAYFSAPDALSVNAFQAKGHSLADGRELRALRR